MIGAFICELNIIRIDAGIIKALRQLTYGHKHIFHLKSVIIML